MTQRDVVATPTDAELVSRALGGDTHAFSLLYRRHAPMVGRRLQRIVGRPEDAKDLLQMTFIEAHRVLARYEPERSFASWLHGIAFNVTGRYLRARRRKWWLSFGSAAQEREPASALSRSAETTLGERQQAREIFDVLATMRPDKCIAFACYELEQLNITEIGALVGASPQTVWARIQSARKEVRRKLHLDEPSESPGGEGAGGK